MFLSDGKKEIDRFPIKKCRFIQLYAAHLKMESCILCSIDVSAITNLGIGQSCDEKRERRYCGAGLACHQCDETSGSICVRCKL